MYILLVKGYLYKYKRSELSNQKIETPSRQTVWEKRRFRRLDEETQIDEVFYSFDVKLGNISIVEQDKLGDKSVVAVNDKCICKDCNTVLHAEY